MTRLQVNNRTIQSVVLLLILALVAALAAAALSARAESEAPPPVAMDFLIGDGTSGNEFPDDFRAQYRLKFGETDSGERGTQRNHVVNVNDGSEIRMLRLTIQPGEGIPWHTHPGPLLVAIAEGALTVTWSSDCEARTYEAGQAFVDLGQEIHKAENLFDGITKVYITAIGIPDGEPVSHVHGHANPC